jgi:F-type H+-transporting ATPase subunit delta
VKDTTVAARYAKALFLVTEKRAETERALQDIQGLAQVLAPGTRTAMVLASPQVGLADKRKALQNVLETRALRSVAVFVDLLVRKRRLAVVTEVAAEFERLVEDKQGVTRAPAVSATPLTAAELERLRMELEKTTRRTIKLTTEVDPRLLGGALVRIGDRVIDRSVKTLLESMEQRLREVSV